jgi:glycosyltransferase involved in cell wall biosynthesis
MSDPHTQAHEGGLPVVEVSTTDCAWSFDPLRADRADTQRTVSCVIWSSNEADRLAKLLPRLNDLLTESGHPWEIVVIDSASSDGTADLMRRWSAIPAVRSVSVADHPGGDALLAGLAAARGDAVIFLAANLHHTLELVSQMIRHWEDGAEVVYALRQGLPEHSALNWFGPSVFDNLMGSPKPLDWLEDCAELTLLNRRVVTFLTTAAAAV